MSQNVVSFSGGKDSTALIFMMLERGEKIDRIINIDTTKEFPQMYKHIEEVQKRISIEIETVKIDFDYWFSEHIKTRGKMKGEKGYGWPDFRNRWCTALKSECFAQLVSSGLYTGKRGMPKISTEIIECHGIAADEEKRLNKNTARNIRYPLAEYGITESMALKYCYDLGFTWDGLYNEGRSRVSCYCCPLQRIGELRLTFENHPHLWDKIQDMDKKSFRKFRSDYSVDDLIKKFTCDK